MKHLILCREYPPAPYPAGGIGTYARHIARLLAEAGETVHMVTQRWDGAPEPVTQSCEGRLTVHRISLDEPILPIDCPLADHTREMASLRGLATSTCPSQVFSWQAARYAERLIAEEAIDVIEAQEWEAPLYYLQLRRMLGLGPGRQPPCIVHLHSPTRMIFEHNEWDKTLVDYLPLSRFEEFSIRAADSLICPSRYLAGGVTGLFGLPPDSVSIIRYPMGETPAVARGPEVWSSNAICYVGRLELRKGVMEWVDAAVQVASTNPAVSFDFFGSDTSVDGGAGESVLSHLMRRIPHPLRARFHFHGSRTREQLIRSLGECAISVVPSRWENLPFTCIEAMATGLPVLASPNGGMAELIRDSESGWLARDGSAAGLAAALRRALQTPPAERAAMGARAASTVRQVCANDVVLRNHMEHRQMVVAEGARRSLAVPGPQPVPKPNADSSRCGIGIVLIGSPDAAKMSAAIASVRTQTQPVALAVVSDARTRERRIGGLDGRALMLYLDDFSAEVAARHGIQSLLEEWPDLSAIAILDPAMRLAPSFAATCEEVLRKQRGVGIVAPWVASWRTEEVGNGSGIETGPWRVIAPPLGQDPLPRGCAIRVQALATHGTEWSAVTYPEPLVSVVGVRRQPRRRYSGMALIQNPSAGFALSWFLAASLSEKIRWIQRVLLHPGRVAQWIAGQARRRRRS